MSAESTDAGALRPSPAAISPVKHEGASQDSPPKKKQKRNKPTLSCQECVERKTKCDRSRPTCLACVKRQCECRYSDVANLIASAERNGAKPKSRRKSTKPVATDTPVSASSSEAQKTPGPPYRSASASSSSSSPFLLSNVPHSTHKPSNIFGLGTQHPFANYWTISGGISEVIHALPTKHQADILISKYFECVDPVYPMITKRSFMSSHEHLWALPDHEKRLADAATLGMYFTVLALGTQFMQKPAPKERAQGAEFYLSAANQSLKLSNYLGNPKPHTLQAMVLTCYCLMNDNHAPDAWSFAGVLARQAFALGFHRDPDIFTPTASRAEKQQRRKIWQAIMFQDTFLTVLLKLPPTTTTSDVPVDSLVDEPDDDIASDGSKSATAPGGAMPNPMSISNIAPPSNYHNPHQFSDHEYIRCMWRLANLVQSTICMPRALCRPLCGSQQAKTDLLTRFRNLINSYPANLTTNDDRNMAQIVTNNPRLARQNLFFRSNYWHCVMILNADESAEQQVYCDVTATLEAARMAIGSFFHLWQFFQVDAGVWWVFQHRAFEEALLICHLLAAARSHLQPTSPLTPTHNPVPEPLFVAAKMDVRKMLDVLEHIGIGPAETQKTKTDVLKKAFEGIDW